MENKIVYVVSGVVRSGTSMMMRALVAGGMTAAYSKKTDDDILNVRINGYVPNEYGYYELYPRERNQKNFPAMYAGKVVKLLLHRKHEIESMPDNVIFKTIMMRRDREEILRSANRVRVHVGKELNNKELMASIIEAENNISFFKEHSISFDEIWYADVIQNPLDIFMQLQYHDWPIDPLKCAEIPDPNQYRFKED